MSNLPTYNSMSALTPRVPTVSMRSKLESILYDQVYNSCGEVCGLEYAIDEILGTFRVTERK
jgi:hypothetical protein